MNGKICSALLSQFSIKKLNNLDVLCQLAECCHHSSFLLLMITANKKGKRFWKKCITNTHCLVY